MTQFTEKSLFITTTKPAVPAVDVRISKAPIGLELSQQLKSEAVLAPPPSRRGHTKRWRSMS